MELLFALGKISAVFILVLLNGYFVAAEFAIVKVRTTQIEPLLKSGMRRARIAQGVITHLDEYLSATQLGITITSLALGWIGEPVVAHFLEPLFAWAGIAEPALVTTISFAVGFSVITFLHIVLGELAPKSLAIQHAQRVTLAIAPTLHLFFLIFRPFISALNGAANFFLRLFGIQPAASGELAHSEEELRLLLTQGKTISTTSRSILLRAMDLRNRTVREVMVPRTSVVFLSTEKTIEQNLTVVLENQFTRYPLCEENLDSVIGMIHLKDIFKLKDEHGGGEKLLGIKREMLFIPETMPLERALNMFLAKRMLMAVAVDEYGGAAGLITLENVLEEVVGDIRDEFDIEPSMVQKINDAEFIVDGSMALHDFAQTFDVVPESKDVVTVSGFVLQLLGRVPEKGATLEFGQWSGSVDAVEGKTVRQLRIKRLQVHKRQKNSE